MELCSLPLPQLSRNDLPGLMPCPFTAPPLPVTEALVRAVRAGETPVRMPAGLRGRAGVLIAEDSAGGLTAYFAFEETALPEGDWQRVTQSDVCPERDEAAVPAVDFTRGDGSVFTLHDFFAALFAPYPDKALQQGGFELLQRKARWRGAVTGALNSPAVRLLQAVNVRNAAGEALQPLALSEWWEGTSPAHEVRFAGTFYPPRAAAKFLIEALLKGHPAEGTQPRCALCAVPAVPVIYEDDAIVVVNKPTRLASVPGVREMTSAKALLEQTRGPLRTVHRLDMDTSGVLLFAKTPEAERVLHESFRMGLAMKRYEARLEGKVAAPRGRVMLPLAVNTLDRPRQCVLSETAGGKPSATDWELMRQIVTPSGTVKSVISLWPETGRTHQLRLHCAHAAGIGLPIDGDPFYGHLGLAGERDATRLCLHAAELTLPHPVTGLPVTFEAPADFPVF